MCGLSFLPTSRCESVPEIAAQDINDQLDQYQSQRVTVYGHWVICCWNVTAVTSSELPVAIPPSQTIRILCRGLLAERVQVYARIGRVRVGYFTGRIRRSSEADCVAELYDVESVTVVTAKEALVINPYFCDAPRPETMSWYYTPLSEWDRDDNLPPIELRENLIRAAYDICRLVDSHACVDVQWIGDQNRVTFVR